MSSTLTCLSLISCGVLLSLQAATLDGIKLGSHVSGPKVNAQELAGRVVLFEYWGVNCPPCIRAIPHVTELQHSYGRDSLVIIANQCQTQDTGAAAAKWKSSGGDDSVSVINFGKLTGAQVSGIPRAFLFDHTGKLIFDGSPFQVDDHIKKACAAAPGALVAGMDYKHLQKEAAHIGKRAGSFKSVVGRLQKALASDKTDPAAKKEAAFLIAKVAEWTEQGKTEVAALVSTNPVAAMEVLDERMTYLKGMDEADWFKDKEKELKKDKAFKNELKAYETLLKISASAEEVGLFAAPNSKAQARNKASFIKAIASLQVKYDGTIAATDADKLLARLR